MDRQKRAQHTERESPAAVSGAEVMEVRDLEAHSRSSLKSEKRTLLTRYLNQCTESPNHRHFASSYCTQDSWPRSYKIICHRNPQLPRIGLGESTLYFESGVCLQHEICVQLRGYPHPYSEAACVSEEKYARIAKLALGAEEQESGTTPFQQLREQPNQKRNIMNLRQLESSYTQGRMHTRSFTRTIDSCPPPHESLQFVLATCLQHVSSQAYRVTCVEPVGPNVQFVAHVLRIQRSCFPHEICVTGPAWGAVECTSKEKYLRLAKLGLQSEDKRQHDNQVCNLRNRHAQDKI